MSISSVVKEMRTKLEELEAEVNLLERTISCSNKYPNRAPHTAASPVEAAWEAEGSGAPIMWASPPKKKRGFPKGQKRPFKMGPTQKKILKGVGLSTMNLTEIARKVGAKTPGAIALSVKSLVNNGYMAKDGHYYRKTGK